MKIHWLLPGTAVAMLVLSAPAAAARLKSWRFDASQNRLEINTIGDVQPQAQLIFNPTRLVIDLPGTELGQNPINQNLGGKIRAIRVGQFNSQTTRLVLELSPGYTLDPKQVKFVGTTASNWSVQLPQPKLKTQALTPGKTYNFNVFTQNTNTTDNKLTSINTNVNTSRLAQSDTSFISTVQSVKLNPTGTQLVIRADRNLTANGGWDRTTGLYRIVIANAKLAPKVKGPQLNADSPLLRIRLQQQDPRTVVVLVQPASRVSIGRLNQIGDRFISVNLRRSSMVRNPLSQPIFGLTPPQQSQPIPRKITNQPISRPSRPLSKRRIVIMIDPGHGGRDSGAVGIGRLLEKDVVLSISKTVASVLSQNGIQVLLTRDSDYFVTLPARVQMSRKTSTNLFVSIHANAVANRPHVSGVETFFYSPNSKSLAQAVQNNIIGRIGNLNNRGVKRARFYVLRKNTMPAILVETGFVTGTEDNARLRNPQYQKLMGEAIANGILEYLRRR
ncbi:N-acetylmuramoyl-L-alanine amidase [Calothrix rhizosoleniae]|uniref:N-acetylmuramoyl-L-alanine amidase n=1 Tax=Calothrix rhizosoleniae TaxID=888997 RepID=UPI000B49E921|nr:N-acetylmuramoyl-L-alanine amidase [Calothrix rhizosoleniae]